jgi:hypothetical protein
MLVLAIAVTVAIHAAMPVNQFVPARTFGAGVDGRGHPVKTILPNVGGFQPPIR